ncbi:MAG: 30S ribosomal protein S6 [Chloroflexi bacterium]|nr:30S ribosomal protein S6 [Chloroflexota bacterium]
MRDYELVVVVSPEAGEEQTTETVERISRFITEQGGSVSNQEQWGVRRLAYPIQKFHEGNYFITEFTLEPAQAVELEASVQASQEILRHLLVKRDD